MPHTHLLLESAAREKVLRGATALADAVRFTLGPKSKSVLIGRRWGRPIVCNDGVTIAKELDLEDAEERLGAQVIREAAERMGEAVGDGTTTATLLAHAIYADGVRNVTAGASAMDLKRGLEHRLQAAITAIRGLSRPVQTTREKEQIGTISAHNDPAIGRLVAQAIERVGPEGVVTVEEAKGTETALDVVEGMQFDRGYLSALFRDRCGTDGSRARRAVHPAARAPHHLDAGLPPAARGRGQVRAPAPRGGGRRGGRRPGDLGGESVAGDPGVRRREGARIRRPPEGHAAGHGDPHGRQGDRGRPRTTTARSSRSGSRSWREALR